MLYANIVIIFMVETIGCVRDKKRAFVTLGRQSIFIEAHRDTRVIPNVWGMINFEQWIICDLKRIIIMFERIYESLRDIWNLFKPATQPMTFESYIGSIYPQLGALPKPQQVFPVSREAGFAPKTPEQVRHAEKFIASLSQTGNSSAVLRRFPNIDDNDPEAEAEVYYGHPYPASFATKLAPVVNRSATVYYGHRYAAPFTTELDSAGGSMDPMDFPSEPKQITLGRST